VHSFFQKKTHLTLNPNLKPYTMKKQLITVVFATLATLSFAQQTSTVEINTKNLEPIVYSSEAELKANALPRIEVLKAELAKPNLSKERIVALTELLWRFENAIVVEKKENN
jgi:hypothetical protein